MIYVSEDESAALVTHELAFEAVRQALVAAASDLSGVFPAVTTQFKQDQSTAGQLQSLLFGKYAGQNAQNYFDKKGIKTKESGLPALPKLPKLPTLPKLPQL